MKLYELAQQYNTLLDVAEEIDSVTLQDTLESIQEAIDDKAENIAKLIRSLQADTEVIKLEEKRLADRRRAIENRIESIKYYLQNKLEVAGIDKVKRPTVTVSIANNPPSVKVIDEKLLTAYMVQQEPTLDKKAILADLKDGKQVEGAELFRSKGLRFR